MQRVARALAQLGRNTGFQRIARHPHRKEKKKRNTQQHGVAYVDIREAIAI